MNRLLFVCGRMGAGKDTLVDWMAEKGCMLFGSGCVVTKFGLMDRIKRDLAEHFDADLAVLHGTAEQKAGRLPNAHNDMTYREAMRHVASCYDYIEPGHMVRYLMRRIAEGEARWRMPLVVLVNDLRRRRDAELLKEQGAKFIRLTRRSPLSDSHFTETELDDWPGYDAVIHNDSLSVTDTRREAHKVLYSWGWSK